jgi:hypothetical protein
VAYWKAVRALSREFPHEDVERFERILAGALPERQRLELARRGDTK